ncbi:hypothetical protein E2562_029305 [Oryza meyeriana var. granulata]|uniref:Uncharacterized protein n=1 Tax=Oryza meyeriana var. granulata TaxID=110450 RepID=A0A6G1E3R2_9ORYZ|nr:hypothetical protein E2562_029305 [Oryza meyeriana var. granulata]
MAAQGKKASELSHDWPGGGRSSMYARHSRIAYPRVVPGSTFRGRAPMKAGARSLQWKRDPSVADSTTGAKPDMTVAPSSAEQTTIPGRYPDTTRILVSSSCIPARSRKR